ncbi:hypothetical protein SESBI_09042 [Sesbania bispinosa]|nr:hypothetical protein SESBI_09042 [Sesbania bispinosa]
MWWKQKGLSFKRGLRELKNDDDALELASIAESKKCEMEIYLEHGISSEKNVLNVSVPLLTNKAQTENVEVNEDVVASEGLNDGEADNVNDEVPVDVVGSEGLNDGEDVNVNEEVHVDVMSSDGLNDGEVVNVNEEVPVHVDHGQLEEEDEDDSYGSVDSMRGVHFDDSKEERALGADDEFNHVDVGQAEAELNEKVNNMKDKHATSVRSPMKRQGGRRRGSRQQGETSGVDKDGGNEGTRGNVDGFAPSNVENMYTMEEDYESEELLSGAETSDGEARPKYQEEEDELQLRLLFSVHALPPFMSHQCKRKQQQRIDSEVEKDEDRRED